MMQKIAAERREQAAKRADPYYDQDIEDAIRARDVEGRYAGDDPATPEVNEAWEGGTAPSAEAEDAELSMANLKKELATAAEGLGIEVDPKWNKQTILDAIEAAS